MEIYLLKNKDTIIKTIHTSFFFFYKILQMKNILFTCFSFFV
uniref:Uncharacterized protein n=1 Tax=Anguilla anguilla TaxID=7936 RepID=A0A0E9RJT4_ANGAN